RARPDRSSTAARVEVPPASIPISIVVLLLLLRARRGRAAGVAAAASQRRALDRERPGDRESGLRVEPPGGRLLVGPQEPGAVRLTGPHPLQRQMQQRLAQPQA